jgi:hypothetical protein
MTELEMDPFINSVPSRTSADLYRRLVQKLELREELWADEVRRV